MDLYNNMLYVCMGATACITLYARKKGTAVAQSAAFKNFQMMYLGVYLLAFFGDWMQGAYVYALYSSYGFAKDEIAVLFVAGFGSSMVFGTVVGSLADKMGRKKFATLYCITYIASCMTKHFADYWVLMVGRILGGIATSLLFSAFESWMVAEHNKRGFEASLLSDTFSKAMFGNSLVAIASGFVANFCAGLQPLTQSQGGLGYYTGGNIGPFDASMAFLAACLVGIQLFWTENYGSTDASSSSVSSSSGISLDAIKEAYNIIRNDSKVFLIGVCSAIFEGSMYTFVFLWTPLLKAADKDDLPFGLIFAVLMVSCMGGSQLFSVLVQTMKIGVICKYVFTVAAFALLVPVFFSSAVVLLTSFAVFEVCVGLYWPCISTLKGTYVPELQRSAIYNVFRIPLNAIVLIVLLSKMESAESFLCCGVLLLCGAYFVNKLNALIAVSSVDKPVDTMELLPSMVHDEAPAMV